MDHAGPHRVDADALGSDLLGEAQRQRIDCRLRRRVIHVHRRSTDARRHRRDVDDRATLSAVALRHALHRLARAEEAAGYIDREHAVDALGRHFVEARREVDDAGVVHQHADAAEPLIHLLEHAQYIRFRRHVGGDRDATGLPRQLLGSRLVVHVIQRHLVSALGSEARRRRADAAAAAGDEHHARH